MKEKGLKNKSAAADYRIVIILLILAALLISPGNITASGRPEKPHVLILRSKDRLYYWSDVISTNVGTMLRKKNPAVTVDIIQLDFQDLKNADSGNNAKYLAKTFSFKNYDLVISTDNDAFRFLLKDRHTYFKNTPCIFTGVTNFNDSLLRGQTGITGIVDEFDFEELFKVALKLHPDFKKAIIILDSTRVSQSNLDLVHSVMPKIGAAIDFHFLADVKARDLDTLNVDNSVIFLLGCLLDENHRLFSLSESAILVAQKLPAPAYTVYTRQLSTGILGSYTPREFTLSSIAVEMASEILNGKDISAIPITKRSSYYFRFSYSALMQFGVDLNSLPPNSFVVDAPEGFFSKNKVYILGFSSGIAVLSAIIIILSLNIKRRKKAEHGLMLNQERLNLALESSDYGIFDWDIVSGQIYFSQRWFEMIGYTNNEIEGSFRAWHSLIHEDDLSRVLEEFNSHIKNEKPSVNVEYRVKHKSGAWRFVHAKGKVVQRDENGRALRMTGTHKDITERMQYELALKDSEKRFRSIVEQSVDGITMINEKGNIIEWNEGIEKITGIKRNDAIGQSYFEMLNRFYTDHENDSGKKEELIKNILGFLDNGTSDWMEKNIELEICRPDNSLAVIEQRLFPIITDNRFMAGSLVRDITKVKEAEKSLRQSEKRFRELAELLPQTVFEVNLQGVLTYANSSSFRIFGYEREDFSNDFTVFQTLIPDDRKRAKENIERLLRGEKFAEEYTAIRKDGSTFPIIIHSTPIFQENSLVGLRGIIVDITERKKIEEEIRQSEERYRTLIENQGEGVIVADENEMILYCNSSAEEIFGVEKGALINRNLKEFTDQAQYKIIQNETQSRKKGQKGNYEIEIIRPDRQKRFLRIRVTPHVMQNNQIMGAFGIFQDITQQKLDLAEKKKSELELIEAKEAAEKSDRLKSEFLAQMSHEIRTPLNSILSFTSLLKEELEDKISDELKQSFRIIDNGGRRLIRTIDLLLNMSQLQTGSFELSPSYLSLSKDVLENVLLDFYQAAKEKNLQLLFKNQCSNEKVFADVYTVSQIFTNILDNAIKYTPSGKIEIRLYNNYLHELCAEISDTGIGISQHYLPYLFTAFSQEESGYTRRFEGNGLGLALVKKYAELNNASIEVKSTKGKGSTFTVIFNTAEQLVSNNMRL